MLVPCTVESVRVHVLTGQHVVLLQAKESNRLLPIWIGPDQAHSIATRIAGIASERPLTHDLMMDVLTKLGVEIDCRPSDAIALAVRCEARILVSDTVLDRSAISAESEDDENIAVFKEFIQTLPDDPPGSSSS